MRFQHTKIEGCWLIEPEPHQDHRGSFLRTFCREEFGARGLCTEIVQASVSVNACRGTLRGMHYQVAPFAERKLVQCLRGSLFDVVLDLRQDSPTFGQWVGHKLDGVERIMMHVPPGCAHGFQTIEDHTEILYQMSAPHSSEHSRGVRWNDPAFNIRWPLPDPILSERDRALPLLTTHQSARAAPDPCATAASG